MTRRMLYATIFLAVLSLLAVNAAYANNIWVFAPDAYVGTSPSNPFHIQAVGFGPGAYISTSSGYFSGYVSGGAGPASTCVEWDLWGYYWGTTQTGSITSAAFMNYSITNASVGFYAQLKALVWIPGGPGWNTWKNFYHMSPSGTWQDGPSPFTPNPKTRAIDLEITPGDLSNKNKLFMWTYGAYYSISFRIWATVTPGTLGYAWFNGYFKHFTWVFMQDSPLEPVDLLNTTILLSPPVGPVGTNVQVNGTGLAPASPITVSYDNASVANTTSDGSGNFTASFVVPASTTGPHVVEATDDLGNRTDTLYDVFIPSAPLTGDLNGDGRVDGKDLIIVAKQFGKADPNVASMESTASTQVVTYSGITALATIGAVAPTAYALQRKKNKGKRTSEKSTSET